MNVTTRVPPDRLKALTCPDSVALVGASGSPGKLTARPLEFLRRHGFAGRIFPVNPTRSQVMGLPAYPKVTDIPEPVEHAYILLDAEPAIAALEDCARAGVSVVTILADGFAEAGRVGRERQDRLNRIADEAGILLIGPNSTGVVSTGAGFCCTTNAAFATDRLDRGNLAVLSQSGSLIGSLLSRGQARGCGFSTLISVGNEAGAGVGQLGQLLLDDPATEGFVLFLETIRDPEALAAFAEGAAARGKPVVAYMIGRSDEGQALSVSHTGALTGSAEAVSAYLAAIGIRQAETFDTLMDAPNLLARMRLPDTRPRRLTVLTTTGGGGAMLVDQISARGVEIAGCSPATRSALSAQGIPLGHGKLVDVTLAGTKYDVMKEVVSRLIADPETGALLVTIGSSAQFNPELAVAPIIDAVAEAGPDAAPVLAFPLPHAPESLAMLAKGGVPAFQSVEACAESVLMLLAPPVRPTRITASLPDTTRALLDRTQSRTLHEVDAGAVFESLGIPRPNQLVLAPDEPLPEAHGLSFPVVAKLVSADLPHKTEAGAIQVGLADPAALEAAIARMRDSAERHRPGYRLEGILVQEMVRGLGETLVGLTRDPLVGPVLTLGMGGVMTEIYRDTSVRPAPLSVETAREMIREVKGFALLDGFRGAERGDLEALAQAVVAISRLACAEDIAEAEINPLLVRPKGDGVVLLDALIHRG